MPTRVYTKTPTNADFFCVNPRRRRSQKCEREREHIYIYIYCHPSLGTTFLHFHKLMCGTRLRIAPLQCFKWPHFPAVFRVLFWKFEIKEAVEQTTPKVHEWPHFWPFFLPKTRSTPRGGVVHSLTFSRCPFVAHFCATVVLTPNTYFYSGFDCITLSKPKHPENTQALILGIAQETLRYSTVNILENSAR